MVEIPIILVSFCHTVIVQGCVVTAWNPDICKVWSVVMLGSVGEQRFNVTRSGAIQQVVKSGNINSELRIIH